MIGKIIKQELETKEAEQIAIEHFSKGHAIAIKISIGSYDQYYSGRIIELGREDHIVKSESATVSGKTQTIMSRIDGPMFATIKITGQ